ncbi:VirB4 family type IV secretion system protein [[Clostridium] innocuum]|uniref:VirB4 family type IV secretion system protein n=1 Tax=Clostridium innocuum TaxID=1522 RepID=UPI000D6BA643|nr:ATP-binding protein [[Clostridium] innocuum]PWJ19770.1 AAA domain-containing protein [[Clostridium] innocuum]SSA37492.1 AAA-like domain-containing protein [[Clostridium] innocuum]
MRLFKKKKVINEEEVHVQEFLDMISPSVIRFYSEYFICGNTHRCVWALREYPTATEEQALLRYLGEKDGLTLHVYARQVTPAEEKKIIGNAANKNRMKQGNTQDLQQSITAQSNLQDVMDLIANMHRSREPLIHCAVYLELMADDYEALKLLQTETLTELVRSKLNVDRLVLRQKEGFHAVMPSGKDMFKEQFERVLPATSVANLFPFNYSGKTDPHGIYLGADKFGSNIIVDFNRRSDDKTNANILILGNSGQGKSYLLKLILCNLREQGYNLINLDPEQEYGTLTRNLGGTYIDMMSGRYIINVLEPKQWATEDDEEEKDDEVPKAFTESTILSQHISFLKDFFRTYKDFTDEQLDTLEIMLIKLYAHFDITERTDTNALRHEDFPMLSDLYEYIDEEFKHFKNDANRIFKRETLREILLLLHSICLGSDSKFFNGHTNITSNKSLTFGVKGLLQANKSLRNALLFNILSFMSNELLAHGYTIASIDELYLFLTNMTAVEYIRNFMKRVRKKESAVILASQNLEDFNIEGIRELTKPLFSIPTHTFLFNAGNTAAQFYIDTLQLEESEYDLIKYPQRGVCLYKCGNERYNLAVHAPEYKEKLFGKKGGR